MKTLHNSDNHDVADGDSADNKRVVSMTMVMMLMLRVRMILTMQMLMVLMQLTMNL